jgi:predicted aspartyl protease
VQGSGDADPTVTDEVGLLGSGGTYRVPVRINDSLTLSSTLDSGATDVLIPADVVATLVRNGTLLPSDFIGEKTYVLADGSRLPSVTFKLRDLRVGSHTLHNVTASTGPANSEPLLGQSFLARFKSWTLDNQRRVIVLTELQ